MIKMPQEETIISFEDVYEFEIPEHEYSVFFFKEDKFWVAEPWDEGSDAIILEDEDYNAFDSLRVIELYGDELTIEEFDAMKEAVRFQLEAAK